MCVNSFFEACLMTCFVLVCNSTCCVFLIKLGKYRGILKFLFIFIVQRYYLLKFVVIMFWIYKCVCYVCAIWGYDRWAECQTVSYMQNCKPYLQTRFCCSLCFITPFFFRNLLFCLSFQSWILSIKHLNQ